MLCKAPATVPAGDLTDDTVVKSQVHSCHDVSPLYLSFHFCKMGIVMLVLASYGVHSMSTQPAPGMSQKNCCYVNGVPATTRKPGQESGERNEVFIVSGFSEVVTCVGAWKAELNLSGRGGKGSENKGTKMERHGSWSGERGGGEIKLEEGGALVALGRVSHTVRDVSNVSCLT